MNKDSENEKSSQINPQPDLSEFVKRSEDFLPEPEPSVLSVSTMNDYISEARKLSIPNKLFGNFWYDSEICILFSDTGLGKSILAVQIADSITKGKSILNFNIKPKPQKIAYLDIELSGKLVEHRYSDEYTNHYSFSEDLYRLEINPAGIDENSRLEDQVLDEILQISNEKSITIFVIDNITALITDFEKSRNAVRLMKRLLNLKKERGLTFLVLAHTPKIDPTKEITSNHLAGSKMLMNFCDSSFSIGKSITNENIRYLKQIKARYGPIEFGTDNVIQCRIEKPSENMLQFIYETTSKEVLFLNTYKDYEKEARAELIVKLRDEKEMSFDKIATEVGVSKGTANKIYHKAKGNKTGKP